MPYASAPAIRKRPFLLSQRLLTTSIPGVCTPLAKSKSTLHRYPSLRNFTQLIIQPPRQNCTTSSFDYVHVIAFCNTKHHQRLNPTLPFPASLRLSSAIFQKQ